MEITQVPSPNITKGRKGYKPLAIVIHIMEGTLAGTDSWFRNPASSVSAHYGIGKDGTVHQYVQESDSAWHAGRVNAPSWKLIKPAGTASYVNPNYYTIGIEHEGNENSDWTDAMYAASAAMIKAIAARWNLPIDRDHIIGHHEIYSLKTCPGFKVDLNKLVAMAGGVQQPALTGEPTKIVQAGTATTTARLNIRKSPGTKFAPVNTVNAGLAIAYEGYTTEGEIVQGNGKWFFMSDGNWFWSGGVK
jgi:N-acetylmuramoyl-L-alanine amidase